MKKFKIAYLGFIMVFSYTLVAAQTGNQLLQSGPMLGYADMREALIWVQTKQQAEVYVSYSEVGVPGAVFETQKVKTLPDEAFTARLIADNVEPGRKYNYELFIDGQPVKLPYATQFNTPVLWKWRGNPPDFTMLTGSCAYVNQPEHDRPGKPYGGDYRIFENMASQKADFMVWLGDNLYLREPDWNTKTGILDRYTHTRSLPELQPFFASTHHYAIWDDHDYGPDNSNKSFFNKEKTQKAFDLFWGNLSYGTAEMKGAISSFQWGDADFFLLDNRSYRDPNELKNEDKTILGEKQLEWLLDNLVTSRATFKMVAMGGQFLSDYPSAEAYSANGFAKERETIIKFIYDHNIRNVIFLSGDVHFSEISILKAEGKPTIYDLTFSTMSAGPNTSGESWNNTLRIPGTVVMERNFGRINFSGPAKERKLTVGCFNTDNRMMWEQIIKQE